MGGQANAGAHGRQRTGAAAHGFRHHGNGTGRGGKHQQQPPVDLVQAIIAIGDQLIGAEHARGHANHGRQHIDQRAALAVQVEHGGTQRRTGHAGGKALHHA